MLKLYWLICLAIGWWLAGASHAQDIQTDTAQKPRTMQIQESDDQEQPPAEDASLEQVPSVIENHVELKPAETSAKDQVYYSEQDLEAQRSMALSTKEIVNLGKLQIAISLIGLILIGFTVVYARSAARAAADTVEEARKTTRVALDSVLSGRRLERAYIFEEISTRAVNLAGFLNELEKGKNGYPTAIINYSLKNHGKTPAIIKEFSTGSDLRSNSDFPVYNVADQESEVVLVPGESLEQFFGAEEIKLEDIEAIKLGEKAINFYATITYEDVFGDEHITSFYWQFRSDLGRFGPYRDPIRNKNYRT